MDTATMILFILFIIMGWWVCSRLKEIESRLSDLEKKEDKPEDKVAGYRNDKGLLTRKRK